MSEKTAQRIIVRLPMNPTSNDIQHVWCQIIAEDEKAKAEALAQQSITK